MCTPLTLKVFIPVRFSWQEMSKFWTVTTVTIIVDNFRERPFWLELKDYRQCNPSTSSNWHSPVHLLHPPMSTFFFNFQFNSFPPCKSSVTRFLCSSILLLSVQPLYMILRKLYFVRFNRLFRDWILLLKLCSTLNCQVFLANSIQVCFSSSSEVKNNFQYLSL